MTATKDSTPKNQKRRKRKSKAEPTVETAATDIAAVADSPTVESPAFADTAGRPSAPPVVKGKAAATHICELAERCETLQTRRQLRSFARLIDARPKNVRGLSFVETAIGECLEQSDQAAVVRDQWLLREAAVWGLAWLARSRRAGGSAGGLLEQAVRRAAVAVRKTRTPANNQVRADLRMARR